MQTLIEKLREARKVEITIGKFTFFCMRPNSDEAAKHKDALDFGMSAVYDWKGVTEADIIDGGSAEEIPFDKDLWGEWLRDRPDFWLAIAVPLMHKVKEHNNKIAGDVKK